MSRSDIAFTVGVCVRFQENSKESHLPAVKRIIRYIIGTVQLLILVHIILLSLMPKLQAILMLTEQVRLIIVKVYLVVGFMLVITL